MRSVKAKPLPSLNILNERYIADIDKGLLIRKSQRRAFKKGEIAGTKRSDGYIMTGISGKRYMVHRIIYYMATGVDPLDNHIDHINGDHADNRLANLRLATQVENCRHRVTELSANKSGYRNVSWCNYWGRWNVSLKINGKAIQRKFKDKADAVACARELRSKYYKDYAGTIT